MVLKMISVRDSKVDAYNAPRAFRSLEEAIRAFRAACQDPESDFGRFPEDYSIWYTANFDDEDAEFTPVPKTCLAQAVDLVEAKFLREVENG